MDSKVKISLIGIVVAIIVMLFGNNLIGRFLMNEKSDNDEKKQESISIIDIDSTTIEILDVLFKFDGYLSLSKTPILDKGLFIEKDYTELHFGGINLDMVELNVMTGKGDRMDISYDTEENIYIMPIFENPHLEFNYKGNNYELIVSTKWGRRFDYTLNKISNTRMRLKKKIEIE